MSYPSLASQQSDAVTVNAYHYIAELDLQYIVEAMCAPSYPLPQWTRADAEHCAVLYKNFLILFLEHPQELLVPTREIDEFWHNHILHTKKYHEDCLHIFGHYLHHEPSSTHQPDIAKLRDGFLKTKQYYLEKFNEAL